MNQPLSSLQNLSQRAFVALSLVLTLACSHSAKKDDVVHIDSDQAPPAVVSNDGFVETAQAGEPIAPGGKTLFQRLGGMPTLTAFAGKFVDALAATPQMKTNPKAAAAFAKDQARFKDQLAIQLCELSNGPCQYKGKTMKEAHAGFAITNAQWNSMRVLFIKALRDVGVQKNERMELAARVARMKTDIVSGSPSSP